MRLLLVEDNARLAAAISDMLVLDGHAVDHAGDLATARDFVDTADYDLILLDIMLPDGDGRVFLQGLRKRALDVPVIVLTARSEVSDRVGVLDLGADDYLVKPFDFSELEARVRAGALEVADARIDLRNRELRLFEVFAANPNMIFSKTKLVDRLFSADEDVSENAIEVYVGRLRKHLTGSAVTITTVRGVGYRLSIS
mgnify:CR=1 FL=1